jgi:hypothetical protein
MEPEHHLAFGPFRLETLLRQLPLLDVGQAEGCFRQALDVARRQQAKALELRAALSPSRLWQGQGKGEPNSLHHTEAAKKIQHDQADLLRCRFYSQKQACRDSGWTFRHGAISSNAHRCSPAWPACGLLVFYDKVHRYMPQTESVILHAVTEFFA